MKITFSRMAAVVLTMWLGLAAGTANAITPIPITGWTFAAPNSYTASFSNDSIPGPSLFNDWFSFSLPASATGSGLSAVIGATSDCLCIRFSAFDLYESTLGLIASGPTGPGAFLSALSFSGGLVPGSYFLNVAGENIDAASGGAYGGKIVVGAIPEPETYAMLLAGLGLLGFSARRRMKNS